jgi:hypothetical protein
MELVWRRRDRAMSSLIAICATSQACEGTSELPTASAAQSAQCTRGVRTSNWSIRAGQVHTAGR